ncbi:uncharacterized protein LOC128212835 isoform X2 [Mya arenaria]|uniref:uncharacterized protein LOC128212835 isoform X2 n=1 Tax=Mya arenaria TaxID=6604 RepID=UPI0022DEA01A|nr:uncharacterized protein LOC128212835 isoform X2 [Mya arenaria]
MLSTENLSSQNKSMRREVQESLIRCYLQTGQLRQAEEGLEQLLPDCVTDDHYCQALILKKKIYKESGNIEAEAQSIHHLLFHHPNNSNFWADLGDLYGRQLALNDNRSHTTNSEQSKTEVWRTGAHLCPECSSYVEKSTATCDCTDTPGSDNSNKLSSGQQEPRDSCCEKDTCRCTDPTNSADTPNIEGLNLHTKIDPKDYEKVNDGDEDGLFVGICPKLAILTCYSRARLLLQCVHSTVGSFIKDRNTAFVRQLEEKIQNLHLKDSVVEAAEQFVRNDLFEDDRLEETESKEQAFSDGAVTVFEFNQRWFLRAKNL